MQFVFAIPIIGQALYVQDESGTNPNNMGYVLACELVRDEPGELCYRIKTNGRSDEWWIVYPSHQMDLPRSLREEKRLPYPDGSNRA